MIDPLSLPDGGNDNDNLKPIKSLGGRPSKRTPEVVAKIAECISEGLADHEAAAVVGINRDTLRVWRQDPQFTSAIEKADAERLRKRINRIEDGQPGWQGSAWLLERKDPQRFSRPEIQLNQALAIQNNIYDKEAYEVLNDPVNKRVLYQILHGKAPEGGEPQG
jgi:hypothetical protein